MSSFVFSNTDASADIRVKGTTLGGSTVFTVDTSRFLWTVFLSCLIIELTLVYLDLTINWLRWSEYGPIRRLFNITREDGLASWFAVTQTVFVALTAWILWAINRKHALSSSRLIGWLIVAIFFTYMAVDDGAVVHERLGSAFKASEGGQVNFMSYPWQLLLAPVFAAMGLFLVVFLRREMPRPSDRVRIMAAITCFAVAMYMDFIEGMDGGYDKLVEIFSWSDETIRHFAKSIEEFIEMLGMTLFLITFLGQIAHRTKEINIQFKNS